MRAIIKYENMKSKFKILLAVGTIAFIAAACNNTAQTPANNNTQSSQGQNEVAYTGSGFSPSTLTVKNGDTVTFVNNSSSDMWVASNPHPIHDGYPTSGGCISSTFDSCSNIAPGQSWSFKFDITGNWGYHNHLNPSQGGTIVVQ